MNQMLPVEDSFDIVQRDIQIGGKDATFYFIDGFTKDESMLKIMDSFFNIKDLFDRFNISRVATNSPDGVCWVKDGSAGA